MNTKLKFVEGEKVLCFHGPLLYEAKALKSQITKDKQIKYYIHYAGWNKNWDEWVPESRVLKFNEANVQRQKEVLRQHSIASRKKATPKSKKCDTAGANVAARESCTSSGGSESRASTPTKEVSNSSSTATSAASRNVRVKLDSKESEKREKDEAAAKDEEVVSKKRRTASTALEKSTNSGAASSPAAATTNLPNRQPVAVESESTFLSRVEVKIKIPDELKSCLADDWDAVTRQHKLVEIPAYITVQDIVDQYIFHKKSTETNGNKDAAAHDMVDGIIEYFNVMLGSQLLYKFERSQYAEVLLQHPDKPLSKLYGGFHLLRLFVKLGSMLAYSKLDDTAMQILLAQLSDFLNFLVKNQCLYFSMTSFVNASPEYHRNTQ